jgi:predicted DNA-binding antitoxin AbrB/MazE fold protein
MAITVEAVYENGVLKPTQPLPLKEHENVRVTVHTSVPVPSALGAVEQSYGLLQWTGDPDILRRIAEEDEFGIQEAR